MAVVQPPGSLSESDTAYRPGVRISRTLIFLSEWGGGCIVYWGYLGGNLKDP